MASLHLCEYSGMAALHLYSSPAALLLLLVCPLWQLAQALPLTGRVSDQCVSQAQALLHNITGTLSKKELFSGMDCSKQSLELHEETQTAWACWPKGPTCSGTIKSEFNKERCLTNIAEDLQHYLRFLSAQPDPEGWLHATLLPSTRQLLQNCFAWDSEEVEEEKVAVNHPSSYAERLKLCKVLRGFQVRSITINRAVKYMNAGADAQPSS
nr:interleukin 12 [Takifugu obscurus]